MENITITRSSIKWGLIAAVVMIFVSVVTTTLDLWKNSFLGSLPYLILIAIIILGIKEFKKLNKGYVSTGQGLTLGAFVGAISGLLSSLWSQIYMTFIDSTFMQKLLDFQREKMEEKGLTEAQIDAAMQMTMKFMSPGLLMLFGFLAFLVIGAVVGLIAGAILRKEKPVFE